MADLGRGIEQFSDKQRAALGFITNNQNYAKSAESEVMTINGVNVELMLLDGLTREGTEDSV